MLYHGTARPKMVQGTEPGKLKTAQEQPPTPEIQQLFCCSRGDKSEMRVWMDIREPWTTLLCGV